MFSNIFLSKQNLIDNVSYLKSISGSKICVMVKANAYGHGEEEVVEILSPYVDAFGVSNQWEAFKVIGKTDKPVIVFGACEDYLECIKRGVHFALLSLSHAKEIVRIYKKNKIVPHIHLCVNTGMNRYGIRAISEFKKIISILKKQNLQLDGIYTHFSSLTTDENYTVKQQEIFKMFTDLLPQEWECVKHVGGGRSIFENIEGDMHRIGLYAYGYGAENLKPVMRVESKIVDIQKVKKGEHIGYLCGYTAQKDMTVATIPLGYADGLPRKLSNTLEVKINGKKAKSVGNICMDAFMVDVSEIKCKVGDKVVVMDDATVLAQQIESTEYEVLTNISKVRGERKII